MSKYPPIEKQIAEFGIWVIAYGKIKEVCELAVAKTYYSNEVKTEIHHYIREQMYYRNPERYKGMQKLILIPKDLHDALHSGISDKSFLEHKSNDYRIERDVLLYRHRKVDIGFWDKDGNYKEDIQIIDEREI